LSSENLVAIIDEEFYVATRHDPIASWIAAFSWLRRPSVGA
jgi:hypothetical protein